MKNSGTIKQDHPEWNRSRGSCIGHEKGIDRREKEGLDIYTKKRVWCVSPVSAYADIGATLTQY